MFLLTFELPFYIVVLIRDLENIFYSKSDTIITLKRTSFARVDGINVNNIHKESLNNYNNIKDLTTLLTNSLLVQTSCLLLKVQLTILGKWKETMILIKKSLNWLTGLNYYIQ